MKNEWLHFILKDRHSPADGNVNPTFAANEAQGVNFSFYNEIIGDWPEKQEIHCA